jgi:hypothetical protein
MRQARGLSPILALALALGGGAGACSDALEQTTSAGQVVAVVNAVSGTVSLVPVDDRAVTSIALQPPGATFKSAAVLGTLLAVPAADSGSLTVFDFANGQPPVVTRRALPANSGAAGVVIAGDTIAWVANPSRNSVTRINLKSGDTASFGAGVSPQAVAVAGGFVYVVNGNLVGGVPAGPSWITVRSTGSGALASVDSIPLSGTNARFVTLGLDGLLYVVDAGRAGKGEGKLSIVDPQSAVEQVVVNGLGDSPGPAIYHPSGRLLIASLSEGILEIDTSTRVLTRGAGNGIKPPGSAIAALTLDERGRVYALDQGSCTGPGVVYVLSPPPDYNALQQVPVGICPVAAATMLVP